MKLICSFHSGSVVLVSTDVSPWEGEGVKATQSQTVARARHASEPLWEQHVLLSRLPTVLCKLWRWHYPCSWPRPSSCFLRFIKGGHPKAPVVPYTAKGNTRSKWAAPPDPEVS